VALVPLRYNDIEAEQSARSHTAGAAMKAELEPPSQVDATRPARPGTAPDARRLLVVIVGSLAIVAIFILWWRSIGRSANSPPVEIGESQWPPLFKSLIDAAKLTPKDRARVSVLLHQEGIDRTCVLRMPATAAALAFVAAELPRIRESELHESFWRHGVTREEFGLSSQLEVFATEARAVNDSEEYTALYDKEKDRLVVCYRRVF
jgi:hypothetical protein